MSNNFKHCGSVLYNTHIIWYKYFRQKYNLNIQINLISAIVLDGDSQAELHRAARVDWSPGRSAYL